jgi:hypothetical protein
MAKYREPLIYSDKYTDYINAERLIEDGSDPRPDLEEAFQEFSKNAPVNTTYFEDEAEFMESLGYRSLARDNTYNGETNLDANVLFQVWAHPEYSGRDWVFSEDSTGYDDLPLLVTTFFVGYGDPRGGYNEPMFRVGKFSDGEYSVPVDRVIGYSVEAVTEDGEEFAAEVNDEGRLEASYSSYPMGQVEKIFDTVERDEDGVMRATAQDCEFILTPSYYGA